MPATAHGPSGNRQFPCGPSAASHGGRWRRLQVLEPCTRRSSRRRQHTSTPLTLRAVSSPIKTRTERHRHGTVGSLPFQSVGRPLRPVNLHRPHSRFRCCGTTGYRLCTQPSSRRLDQPLPQTQLPDESLCTFVRRDHRHSLERRCPRTQCACPSADPKRD